MGAAFRGTLYYKGAEILEKFRSVIYQIGQILYIICVYIWKGLCTVGKWIGAFFNNVILPSAPTMLKFFSNHTANLVMFSAAAGYFVIINIVAFSMYGSDKKKAKRKENRISEARLMKVTVFGGAIGAMIGMHMFRHKTLKRKFKVWVPILFIVEMILQSFILGFLGFWAFL